MPYVDPNDVQDPTTGQAILAAWGDAVRNALEFGFRNAPSCSLTQSGAQSIPNAANTNLLFDGEDFDNGGMHSTVTNTARITIPSGEGGVYLVGATLSFVANTTGDRSLTLLKNGTTVIGGDSKRAPSNAAVPARLTVCTAKRFVAGDFIVCDVFQDSTAARNTVPGETTFYAFWLRA